MTISVVIITIGAKDYLKSCLDSLLKQTLHPSEIIVIHNSLKPELSQEINKLYSSVRVYFSPENLFYAASLNKGINLNNCEFILCLNDDVVLGPDYIERLVKAFDLGRRIGMVSGKILRMDKTTIDSTGLFLGRSRKPVERGYNQPDRGQFDKEGYIFGVCGAAAFYRREMLEDIKNENGYFDERYGMFYEDLDLSWRANKRGWMAYYNPRAVAYHARGGSARRREGIGKSFARIYITDELQFELVKNRWMTMIKNESVLGFLLHLPFILAYDIAEFVFLLVFRPKVIPKLASLPKYLKSAFRKRLAARVAQRIG